MKTKWQQCLERHANTYHTTVPCIAGRYIKFNIKTLSILSIFFVTTSTHKIVAISTVARPDHVIAQTKELAITKKVLPNVIAKGKMKFP